MVFKISKNSAMISFSLLVIFTTSFIIQNIYSSKNQYINQSNNMLFQEAKAHFDNMVNTRSWNAKFSGVFVLPKENLAPNPYLKDNHIYTSDGKLLVKINPAWMTRQISEIANSTSNYLFKITSLKPINPNNKPDIFETEALKNFEKNNNSKFYTKIDDKYYNFMGALKVEQSCLYCHEYQGYKLGDIRGGLRVSIPIETYKKNVAFVKKESFSLSLSILLISIGVILIGNYFISLIYKRQETIEYLNKNLEQKVKQRTQDLENLYEHEKYLKGILSVVAQVNETLITSYSIHSIAKNCIIQLTKHLHYGYLWIGFMKDDNTIDILANSTHIPKELLDIYGDFDAKQTIIEKVDISSIEKRRKDDFDAKWKISIPIKYSSEKYNFGVLTLYSDRDDGFLPEEVNMLENIASDIALSMQNQIHKNILKQMEIDRVENYENTILAFVNIIEQRDTYTAGHTVRVAEYCRMMAVELGIPEAEIKKLEKAAILHDIGKVATPDSILLKPGQLTKLEYELIKHHSKAGYEMLSKIDMYKDLAEIVRYHHSRYDGFGYPATKSPNEIPFLSHIMIVADAFDAMTTNRIYKPRMSVLEAVDELNHCSGAQFHPEVIKAAVKVLKSVNIEKNTQLPSSELEQKRFSYFFQDSLTSLYNESFLQIVLANKENVGKFIYHIELNNFTQYNKLFGWNKGNELLKEVAETISKNISCDLIFRFHGDDFIAIVDEKLEKQNIFNAVKHQLEETPITVRVIDFKIDENFSIEDLK